MSLRSRRALRFYCVTAIAVQIAFFVELIAFYDILIPGQHFFRILTPDEWNRLLHQPHMAYSMPLVAISEILRYLLSLLCVAGVCHLSLTGNRELRVRLPWSALIPLLGFLVYLPIFRHVKYHAVHYRLYMTYLPAEFLSLILLAFVAIAVVKNQKARS